MEEKTVPEWSDPIVLTEKYKYMEIHDRNWLQLNLDYNFSWKKDDIQIFYSIYKDERPLGFL